MTEFPTHGRGPMAGRAAIGLGALLLVGFSAGPARSHAIESSLVQLSGLNATAQQDLPPDVQEQLELNSRFSTGEPAEAAAVTLLPPDGRTIEIGRTDATGRLRFALPDDAAPDWELLVDAGPGHRDYLELAEAGTALPLAARPEPLAPWRRPLPGGLALGLGAAVALVSGRRRH